MAYITRRELAERLPNDGDGLTDDELDGFITDAVSRAEAENASETGYSRAGVARMAMADALEVLVIRDATMEAPIVDSLRKQAERYFEYHDKAAAATSEADSVAAVDAVAKPFPSLWSWSNGSVTSGSNPTETRYPTWYG